MKIDIFNTKKKYKIIYADPPWLYKTWSKKGNGSSAEKHYPCMKKEDIQALPIPTICEKDCILFLWVTMPNLIEGLELIEKWGFTYKTCAFTWVKKNKRADSFFMGNGFWTRANAELCLLATKGKPKKISSAVRSLCVLRIREHSRKPDEIRDRIIALLGDIPRIELFARQVIDGWDCWGNEI